MECVNLTEIHYFMLLFNHLLDVTFSVAPTLVLENLKKNLFCIDRMQS